MNKLILGCLVLVALLSVYHRWTDAVPVEDDHMGVKRSLLDDDDDEEFHCSTNEAQSNRKRRSTPTGCERPLTYRYEPYPDDCADNYKDIIAKVMENISQTTDFQFDTAPSQSSDTDLVITCNSNRLNYAKTGGRPEKVALHRGTNKLMEKAAYHELGHIMGLLHSQQERCASEFYTFKEECLANGAPRDQFEEQPYRYEGYSCPSSILGYSRKAFWNKECFTLIANHPTMPDDGFGTESVFGPCEISKIQSICRKCQSPPPKGMYFEKNCIPTSYVPGSAIQNNVIVNAGSTRVVSVRAGTISSVSCAETNIGSFQVTRVQWDGVNGKDSGTKCPKRGNPIVLAIGKGLPLYLSFGCTNEEYISETTPFVVPYPKDTVIYIDGRQIETGTIYVQVTCTTYDVAPTCDEF